ncbi:MAG: HEAT repeat domain-containing protein [Deltaproteobacteria bacterium]
MADTDITEKTLYALVIMNTAIKNVRLYPPTSATIVSAIDRLHQAFEEMLEQENPIVFSESEKSILVCGKPLKQKDQEKVQVVALLGILLSFGLKSLSFGKGMEKAELSAFTEIISRKPDVIKSEGGLSQILANNNVTHIYLDQKVYVAMDKDHQIISSLDITDDQITNFFISAHPELAADPQKLQEKIKDPELLSQAFQAGLAQLIAQKGTLSDVQLTESLGNMIGLLDKVTGSLAQKDRENVSKNIGDAIINTDADMAFELTTKNIEHLFGGVLLQYLINKLEDNKYTGGQKTGEGEGEGTGCAGEAGSGGTVSGQGDAERQEKIDFKNRLLAVSAKLSERLKENEKNVLDESLMSVLPKIIEQLIAHKEQETMEKIISHLANNLLSENEEVRASAAKALTDVIATLPPERRAEMIGGLSGRLIKWIKIETSVTPAYKTICDYLQNILQDFIYQMRFPETIPLLDVFDEINSGTLKKNEAIREVCAQLIRNLATEVNITLLFKEFKTNAQNKKDEAGKVLSMFGNITINRMLDNLQEDIDSDERVRIMHLIIGTGQRAIPLVRERIHKDEPWYYLRNMAYLLGQIGNEESAGALQPLLRHKNERLRQEALKSILRTGGKRRGQLLISALQSADDKFKLSLIDALGSAKAADSVPELLNILTTRPFVTTTARVLLEESICTALGAIGSAEAIPVLSEIAGLKSFFSISSYPDKLKAVAARALESIRKKQTAGMPKIDTK